MRIENNNLSFRKSFFSRPATIIYFLVFIFFAYKSLNLFPIWLRAKNANLEAKQDLEKKQAIAKNLKVKKEENESNLGQKRYQKEFFNELEEGEELIILYDGEKKPERIEERDIQMFWWEEMRQNVWVWWKNM